MGKTNYKEGAIVFGVMLVLVGIAFYGMIVSI